MVRTGRIQSVVADGTGAWIFHEAFDLRRGRGRIDAIRLGPDGVEDRSVPVLYRDFHLSSPTIFRWEGSLWMAPESAESGSVQLLRFRDLPDDLEPAGTLIDEPLLNPTVFCAHDGVWWLFGTKTVEHTNRGDDLLYLWNAPTPMGPWTPHVRNPIVVDGRCARPAGGLFIDRHKRLIRPAQDNTGADRRTIVLCEVTAFDSRRYEERVVGNVDPNWSPGVTGCHTTNADGDIRVFDTVHSVA